MLSRQLAIDTLAAFAGLAVLAALPALAMEETRETTAVARPDLAYGALAEESELIGLAVADAEGAPLGEVDAVVTAASGQGRFLVIGTGAAGEGRYLPVPEHRIVRAGPDRLQTLLPAGFLADAPRFAEADFASGPGGWPEGLETWWLERLEGPELMPRPRPRDAMTMTGEQPYPDPKDLPYRQDPPRQ